MALKRYPAEMEYKRNPKLTKSQVLKFLDWARKQINLPTITEEDAIIFLVSCNYDVDYTKEVIGKYFKFKVEHPEMYNIRDPLDERFRLNSGNAFFSPCPGVTEDGYKVIYGGIIGDPSTFIPISEVRLLVSQHDLMLFEEGAVPGWHLIFDMKDLTLGMLLKLRPGLVKAALYYFQDACPVTLKGIDIVNPTSYVSFFLAILKPFLNKSTADAIRIHHTLEELLECYPKRLLPLDFGGDLPSKETMLEQSKRKLVDNRELLMSYHNVKDLKLKEDKRFWGYLWS